MNQRPPQYSSAVRCVFAVYRFTHIHYQLQMCACVCVCVDSVNVVVHVSDFLSATQLCIGVCIFNYI